MKVKELIKILCETDDFDKEVLVYSNTMGAPYPIERIDERIEFENNENNKTIEIVSF